MPSRRGGRWVFWPARLLWLPVLAAGLWLLMGMRLDVARVDGDTWRLLFSLAAPDAWFDPVWRGAVGLAVLVAGLGLAFAYFWEPGPYRALTAVQYRIFSWTAMAFTIVALLSAFSLSRHVVELGVHGMDWRLLATLRSHPLDYLLLGLSGTAAVTSYLLSWGVSTPAWAREPSPTQN